MGVGQPQKGSHKRRRKRGNITRAKSRKGGRRERAL